MDARVNRKVEVLPPAPDTAPAGIATIEAQRAKSEVESAIAIAKRFARDEPRAVAAILADCDSITLAEQAQWRQTRGRDDVSGASIVLAKTMVRHWGNIEYGVREIARQQGSSQGEAYCWDMETNAREKIAFTVTHCRDVTRDGSTVSVPVTTEGGIKELVSSIGARYMRVCMLAVLPEQIINAALARAAETVRRDGGEDKAAQKTKMLGDLFDWGVTSEMITERYGHAVRYLTNKELAELRRIRNAIADGHLSARDFFDVADKPDEHAKRQALNSARPSQRSNKQAPVEPWPAPATNAPAPPPPGASKKQPENRRDTAADEPVMEALIAAFEKLGITTTDLVDFLGHPLPSTTCGEVDELRAYYKQRKTGDPEVKDDQHPPATLGDGLSDMGDSDTRDGVAQISELIHNHMDDEESYEQVKAMIMGIDAQGARTTLLNSAKAKAKELGICL